MNPRLRIDIVCRVLGAVAGAAFARSRQPRAERGKARGGGRCGLRSAMMRRC